MAISGTCSTVAPASVRRPSSVPGDGRVSTIVRPASGPVLARSRRDGCSARRATRRRRVAAASRRRRTRRSSSRNADCARSRVRRGGEEARAAAAEAVGTERQRAPGAELGEERPLRRSRRTGSAHRRRRASSISRRASSATALDGDTSLPDRRNEHGGIEALGDAIGHAEDLEGGHGHDDRSVGGDLLEAPGDVAAQLDEVAGPDGPRRAGHGDAPSRSPRRRRRRARRGFARSAHRRHRARAQKAARRNAGGVSLGRSLAECTAASARPSSTACWTSLTKTPWPPMVCSGTDCLRSPLVSTSTSSVGRPVVGRDRVGDDLRLRPCLRAPPGGEPERASRPSLVRESRGRRAR